MEIKNPESKRSSQDFVSTNNGDLGQEICRSYTCAFCKRGFSNAQALGGHMNVHRKDRARLQESIQETLFTDDVNLNPTDQLQAHESCADDVAADDDDDGGQSVAKRSWIFKKDDDVDFKKPTLQLSLSIEPSSTSFSSIRSDNLSSLPTEVDLELRLGMDSDTISRDHVITD
ncbi:hypothetical protein R6Q57_003146 [Mikania cordata]